jgi:ribose-phosphate pyrophosphokinase
MLHARLYRIACAVHAVLSGRAIERIEASPLRQLVLTDTISLPASGADHPVGG